MKSHLAISAILAVVATFVVAPAAQAASRTIEVSVIAARNLANKDGLFGKTDANVLIKVGGRNPANGHA
ncbi:hypothetical protein O1L44_02545 [Streptomyces noursei]|uniref:hypothetical protein n=1 Tax=Streptomyces noursei TaxID=1971 RepID=UPI00081CEF82|nr:hypothetical protein SNOUR_07630 [Streptomyces noursei ATCC 11455]MCZ0992240.1 hypothetical protein [Streptomyces noursei]